MKKSNNMFWFLIIMAVSVLVCGLRNAYYPQWIVSFCSLLSDYMIGFINSVGLLKSIAHTYTLHGVLARVSLAAVCMVMGYAAAKLCREKTAEASAAVYCNIGRVIKYGIVFILLNLIMIYVLVHSVVGIMAAVFNVVVIITATFIGLFYFSVVLGSYFQQLYNGNARSVETNCLLGMLTVSVCFNIYGFVEIMTFFVMPVLGCGSFIMAAYSRITNMHFDTSLVGFEKEHFDRDKIRDIITRDIDR